MFNSLIVLFMLTLFQVNTKGQPVPTIGGAETEREAIAYALRIIIKAKGMEPKNGAKYLRTLGVSRNQAVYFDTFKSTNLKRLGTIRLGQFVDNYDVSTLYAIIEALKNDF
jgi:hypothetical protein